MTFSISLEKRNQYFKEKNSVKGLNEEDYSNFSNFESKEDFEDILEKKKREIKNLENFLRIKNKIKVRKIIPKQRDLKNFEFDARNYDIVNSNMIKTKNFKDLKKNFIQDKNLNQKNIIYIKNGKNIDINQNLSNIRIKNNENLKNVKINQSQKNKNKFYKSKNQKKVNQNQFKKLYQINNLEKNIELENFNENLNIYEMNNEDNYKDIENYIMLNGKQVPISEEEYNKILNFQNNENFENTDQIVNNQEIKIKSVELIPIKIPIYKKNNIPKILKINENFNITNQNSNQNFPYISKIDKKSINYKIINQKSEKQFPQSSKINQKSVYYNISNEKTKKDVNQFSKMKKKISKDMENEFSQLSKINENSSINYKITNQKKKNSDNYNIKVNSYIKNGNLNLNLNKVKNKIKKVISSDRKKELNKLKGDKFGLETGFVVKNNDNFNLNIVENGLKIIKSFENIDGKMKEVLILVDKNGKRIKKDFTDKDFDQNSDLKKLNVNDFQKLENFDIINEVENENKKNYNFNQQNWFKQKEMKKLEKLKQSEFLRNQINNVIPQGFEDHGFFRPGLKIKKRYQIFGNQKIPNDIIVDENGNEVPLNSLNQKYSLEKKEVYVGSKK